MKHWILTGSMIAAAAALGACDATDETAEEAAVSAPPTQVEAPETGEAEAPAGLVELRAVGLRFEGPSEIQSGWTTIRFENVSDMVHFAVVEHLPEGITTQQQAAELAPPFQEGMDLIIAGDVEGAMAVFAALPEWFADVVFKGGPGLLSGGGVAQSTVYLAPGRYTIECYVKTNGVFHSFNPNPGELGMVHELIVTGPDHGAPEPESNATLTISSQGYQITEGALRAGPNTIRAEFVDQAVYENFVGHDAHIVRLEEDTDLDALGEWMNWVNPNGLETPAPAVFVGGINEMPAGEHGYFTVDLEPGDYAIIAEIADPQAHNLVMPFTIE